MVVRFQNRQASRKVSQDTGGADVWLQHYQQGQQEGSGKKTCRTQLTICFLARKEWSSNNNIELTIAITIELTALHDVGRLWQSPSE